MPAPTTKSEHSARIVGNIHAASVNMLVDRLADFAVENERIAAENEWLREANAELIKKCLELTPVAPVVAEPSAV